MEFNPLHSYYLRPDISKGITTRIQTRSVSVWAFLNYLRPDISKGITTVHKTNCRPRSYKIIYDLTYQKGLRRSHKSCWEPQAWGIIYDLTYQKGLRQAFLLRIFCYFIGYYLRPDISQGITTLPSILSNSMVFAIIYDLTYQKGLRLF